MKLVIPCKDIVHVVRQQDILYCVSENSYTGVMLASGERFVVSKPLSRILEDLDSTKFIRVSQSCIVNMEQVCKIDKRKKHIELCGAHRVQYTVKVKVLMEFLALINDNRK